LHAGRFQIFFVNGRKDPEPETPTKPLSFQLRRPQEGTMRNRLILAVTAAAAAILSTAVLMSAVQAGSSVSAPTKYSGPANQAPRLVRTGRVITTPFYGGITEFSSSRRRPNR
jgi:hypothetical protein